jgi:hypothetical protein
MFSHKDPIPYHLWILENREDLKRAFEEFDELEPKDFMTSEYEDAVNHDKKKYARYVAESVCNV